MLKVRVAQRVAHDLCERSQHAVHQVPMLIINIYLGRFGGEEFVVLLPHTGAEAAYCSRACASGRGTAIGPRGAAHHASLGWVSIEAGEAILDELLARADSALYRTKADGRNRVEAG